VRKKWLKLVIMSLFLLAEACLLYRYLPEVLLTGMFLIRRSDCSLKKTLAVSDWKQHYLDSRARITQLSRLQKRDGNLQLWSTPLGDFWMPQSSMPAIFGVLAEMQMNIYGTGPTGIRKGDIVLDCGADVGTYTRLALRAGAKIVVAIDPAKEKQDSLRRNFRQEIIDGRVLVYGQGVWNKEETLRLSNSVVSNSSQGEAISLTTIDALVAKLKLDKVDFIKMDIEGSERKALAGASRTLKRFKPRLAISSEHSPDDSRTIPRTVRSIVPSYSVEHGPCSYLDGRICPYVIYFH